MTKILTSVHGKKLGLGHDGKLVTPSGLVIGEHGRQRTIGGPATVELFDDFLGDVLADEWNYVEGTDASPTNGAVLASGIGGVLQLTTGDAGTGLAADLAQVTSFLNWKAANGNLCFEARLKMSAITVAYAFIGFTDLITLEAPIISASSANTLTSNASDAVGFMFDTNMTTDNLWLTGVKADTDATAQNVGSAPVAGTYATYRIEIDTSGNAQFYINGVQVGTKMANAVTAATALTPVVAFGNLSGTTSKTMDIDYVHVSMSR